MDNRIIGKYKKEKEAKTVLIPFHADRQLDYNKQVFYRGGYLFLQSIKAMNFAKIQEQGFIPLYKREAITDVLHEVKNQSQIFTIDFVHFLIFTFSSKLYNSIESIIFFKASADSFSFNASSPFKFNGISDSTPFAPTIAGILSETASMS